VADAASILNVAQGTIKSRCARGRAAMAALLGLDTPSGKSVRDPPKEPMTSP
jgi:RNA polymerase sigma-70 factor (ECF subfamily)